MPAMKTKLQTEELEALVRLVRSFRDGRFQVPEDGDESSNSSRTEPAVTFGVGVTANQPSQPAEEAEYPTSFFKKLIRWLGKFHPPLVHFPIALLTAAAVARVVPLLPRPPKTWIVAGGGTRNPTLMRMLGERLGPAQVETADVAIELARRGHAAGKYHVRVYASARGYENPNNIYPKRETIGHAVDSSAMV